MNIAEKIVDCLLEFGNIQACRGCGVRFPIFHPKAGHLEQCPDCGCKNLVPPTELLSFPYNGVSKKLYGEVDPKDFPPTPEPRQDLPPDIIAGLRRNAGQ